MNQYLKFYDYKISTVKDTGENVPYNENFHKNRKVLHKCLEMTLNTN
jgi:hypothetical protein